MSKIYRYQVRRHRISRLKRIVELISWIGIAFLFFASGFIAGGW